MIDLSIAVDIDMPLSRDEAREYCLKQGIGIYSTSKGREVEEDAINWLLNHSRPHQAREAVRRNLDIMDFDEWQSIEDVLLANSSDCITSELIPLATALKINTTLWEDLDLSPMDLEKGCGQYESETYKLELRFSYMNEAGEFIDIPGEVFATDATIEEVNKSIESLIWRAIDWYHALDNTKVLVNKLITKNDEYVDSDDFTIRTSIVREGTNIYSRALRDISSFEMIDKKE